MKTEYVYIHTKIDKRVNIAIAKEAATRGVDKFVVLGERLGGVMPKGKKVVKATKPKTAKKGK